MTQLDHGPGREIWLAKVSDPSTKYSFIIRDDAYGRSAAIFSKTVRLGDPIAIGPSSTIGIATWEGGGLQKTDKDQAMFYKGTADGSTERGKLKLWPGFHEVVVNDHRAVAMYIMCSAPADFGQASKLIIAENNEWNAIDPTTGTPVPPGGFCVSQYDASTDTFTTLKSDFSASIELVSRMADQGNARKSLFVGTAAGEFWVYDETANAWYLEAADATYPANTRCVAVMGDAMYFGQLNKLSKRTWISPGPATYAPVKVLTNVLNISALCVWNNQLWITASMAGGGTQVYVSDGVTVQPAWTFPNQFTCTSMVSHYGALYFAGFDGGVLADSGIRGQVWRYTGSARTLLWESTEPGQVIDGSNNYIFDMTSHRQWLVWTRNGNDGTDRKPGLMFYDAEVDAIAVGPTMDMDPASPGSACTAVCTWGDTLAAAFWDSQTYTAGVVDRPSWAGFLKLDGAVRHTTKGNLSGHSWDNQPELRAEYILSSIFDGQLPGETKVWLTGRALVKVPTADTAVNVVVILDETGTEQVVATIGFDGNTGWRPVTFPLKDSGGSYMKSRTMQYKLYLLNNESGNMNSTANPQVDAIAIDFMNAPLRRRQWNMRVVCTNDQERLDGSSNPLNTTDAQVAALELLAMGDTGGSPEPLLFWDAGTAGGMPTGDADAEVWLTSFNAQPFRMDNLSTDIAAEVAIQAVEVVQS